MSKKCWKHDEFISKVSALEVNGQFEINADAKSRHTFATIICRIAKDNGHKFSMRRTGENVYTVSRKC